MIFVINIDISDIQDISLYFGKSYCRIKQFNKSQFTKLSELKLLLIHFTQIEQNIRDASFFSIYGQS